MNTRDQNVGLWLDYRQAIIIFLGREGHEARVIKSGENRQPTQLEEARSPRDEQPRMTMSDDVRDARFTGQMTDYFDDIIGCIHDAESLLILGPGDAKAEMQMRLTKAWPASRRVAMETADKMTFRQIAARVRDHFEARPPVILARYQAGDASGSSRPDQ